MTKTIKIIDLLNKIAQGKEVPKKIKYLDTVLEYDDKIQDYVGLSSALDDIEDLFYYLFAYKATSIFINEEVEIVDK